MRRAGLEGWRAFALGVRLKLRGVLVALLVLVGSVSAWAQKPLAVSAVELSQHLARRTAVEYPAEAKAGHVSGTVVLLVEVSAAGKVTSAEALSGPERLQAAARKCVEQWEYRPFEKDGSAVAATGLVQVGFHLGSAAPAKVEKFLDGVRSKYATEPGLVAQGFSCRVEPEWREFPQMRHVAADSMLLRRLKRTRVRLVVATAAVPLTEVDTPKQPKLNVADLATYDQLVAATRRMVQGFYETWLPFGIVGPTAPADASVKTVAGKTAVVFKRGGVTDWMSFDRQSRMVHFTELMPSGEAVEESPEFVASPNGLLYTGTDFVVHRAGGQAETHGAYRIAYREVDGFRMPKRVEIEVKGSLDAHFRFTGCKVGH